MKTNSWDINQSAPTLLPGQDLSVKPQSIRSNGVGTSQSSSSNSSTVDGVSSSKLRPSPSPSNSSSDLYPQPLSISPSSAKIEHGHQALKADAATPLRSYSTNTVTKVPSRKPVGNPSSPSRSMTYPANSQPRPGPGDPTVKPIKSTDNTTPKKSSQPRTKTRSGVLSVSSEETISELYDTASENISEESQSFPQNGVTRSTSPTFNLFGNGPPPTTSSYPQRYRGPSQAANQPKPSTNNTAGLPANTSASLRSNSRAKPLVKMFVICCQCKFWHDMPSEIYAKFASSKPSQFDHANGTQTRGEYANHSKAGSGARAPVEANTSATKVAPNSAGEDRPTTAIRVNDSKTRYSHPPSGSQTSSTPAVKCCWCDHGMGKSCCAGWTTIVYLHERHH
jgi:hypothetical protein